jgi:hypothetical protein
VQEVEIVRVEMAMNATPKHQAYAHEEKVNVMVIQVTHEAVSMMLLSSVRSEEYQAIPQDGPIYFLWEINLPDSRAR